MFSDERVFTVYIPMKRTPEEEDPTWTMQYALLKEDSSIPVGDQQVSAPSALMREWPQLPAELEKNIRSARLWSPRSCQKKEKS